MMGAECGRAVGDLLHGGPELVRRFALLDGAGQRLVPCASDGI